MKILSRSGGFPNEVETGCDEHLLESAASRLRVLIRRTDIVEAISGIWGIHSFDRDHDIFQPLGSGSGFDARDDRGFNRVMDGIGNRPFRVLSHLLTDNLTFVIHPKIEDSSARFAGHRDQGNVSLSGSGALVLIAPLRFLFASSFARPFFATGRLLGKVQFKVQFKVHIKWKRPKAKEQEGTRIRAPSR